MHSNELIQLGAADLARLIRSRDVDPVNVVDAHIAQIDRVNPRINALVTTTFDKAREEARRIRDRLQQRTSGLPPLLGVPVTVKDALQVVGLRFTAGSTFYRDNVATKDAEAVRRIKEAGAIVLGKTSCSDMSASAETTNLIVGLMRNPWELDHSSGGSSGGEAALIASCGSPLGLGADFGGSIRIPAAFCGVVGLKPTGGRIATEGHMPGRPNEDETVLAAAVALEKAFGTCMLAPPSVLPL
jgi:Asp-tRNA(Asn)/Glu-tRNA(Gln) amidotransferase A subunit family amidase